MDWEAPPFDVRLLPALEAVFAATKALLRRFWPVWLLYALSFYPPFVGSAFFIRSISVPYVVIATVCSTVDVRDDTLTTITEFLNALRHLATPLELSSKVSFFVTLALVAPFGQNASPTNLFSQPWAYFTIAIAFVAVVLGVSPPAVSLFGTVRFAYLRHGDDIAKHYEHLLVAWACVTFSLGYFFPAAFVFISANIVFISIRAILIIHNKYRALTRTILDEAATVADEVRAGVDHMRACVLVGEQHEQQLLEVVATARRDALRAQVGRVTDFFDCATAAWAAIGTVATPATDATERARGLADAAQDVIDTEKPPGEAAMMDQMAKFLLRRANEAVTHGDALVQKLHSAQEAVRMSKDAQSQSARLRQLAVTNAKGACTAAGELDAKLRGYANRLCQADLDARRASRLAGRATEEALAGDIDAADKLLVRARGARDSVESLRVSVSAAVDAAHGVLLGYLQRQPIP